MAIVQKHFLFTLFLLALLLTAPMAYAQSGAIFVSPNPEAVATIIMIPKNPSPGDTVHLTVTGGSLLDLQNSTITWFQNGKLISKGVGYASLDITTGTLGSEDDVNVQVDSPDGATAASSISIIPTHVDLLLDSDSYIPPFYRGRALPSAGTHMQAQALVYFKRSDGSFIPPNSIIYTWKVNGQVIGNVSGKGRQTAVLPAPVLFGTSNVSIEAVSTDNLFTGSASTNISSVEPILMLYEDHPLFGILFHRAMGQTTTIPDSEMTFAAVPYFTQVKNPNDPQLRYHWMVNGNLIVADTNHPSEIVINADKSNGEAAITLALNHASNFLMNAKGSWDVIFKVFDQTNAFFSNF
ncbi:hypothetical protein HZC00_01730 [Candidatus Kaiserbacteria bacterium]|nr:hypothetical protein [Candidatus Kaiserbacteria bacterium]